MVEMQSVTDRNATIVGESYPLSITISTTVNTSTSHNMEQQMDVDHEDATRTQLSQGLSQTYWNGGLSPRVAPTDASPSAPSPKSQRRLSATITSKLLSSVSSPFARRKVSHFVFRDAVEIPVEGLSSEEFEEPSCDLFSKFLMIVMYNLALTLHLHALSISTNVGMNQTTKKNDDRNTSVDRKKTQKLFMRARKLYELAFEMHLDESCDVSLLFTLALINNLGLVYDVLGEKQRAQTCFKNMFSTMMYLMDSNESQSIKEWDGLLSNVMDILFKEHSKVAAPAA